MNLENLHDLLTDELRKRIESGEATTADLNVIRQFLKDNGIQSLAKPGKPIFDLQQSAFGGPDDLEQL